MSTISSNKVSVIDFSSKDLKPGTSSWTLVRTKVRAALEEYGCFELVLNDTVQLHQDMLDSLKHLFDLPLETKAKHVSDDGFEGYTGNTQVMPLFEYMNINDIVSNHELLQRFTNLMWPEGNPSFCETMYSYCKLLSELEAIVKRMVFESFGMEKYYDSYVELTSYMGRPMKYRAPTTKETTLGMVTHTDFGFITILGQNHVNGLNIQAKNGEWISVTPSASSFVVVIGDAFMAWSNGRLHSPPHGVWMSGDEIRYSMGLFSSSKDIVQTPQELIDEEHPLLFKPFHHMALRIFARTEEGRKAESFIKGYCGV
ncbi:hypothetical protein AQUCO_00100666v1 [Aquilegia coerulea]|uniref:Fe2OG dioxygenase domain-containing protein n=1 Tax=Aquilegia coerulea TaxID=218851 RepID=A0A2G5FBI1_AQUCA|nr:hypothetical protein AQUCO_00100666v1 [Aquilegia coerulea]